MNTEIFNNPSYFEEDEQPAPISVEMLEIICKQYPNDADLGKTIRNLVKQIKNA